MSARPVSAGVRRTCVLLAVAGGLAMMTGFLLAAVSALAGPGIPGGRLLVALAAPGLMVAGLCCGVTLIAVSAAGSQRRRARAPVPAPAPPQARVRPPGLAWRHEPDPSEEWMGALRPPGKDSAGSETDRWE